MHAEADLVGDEPQLRRRIGDQRGERVGLLEDRLVVVAAEHEVRDPEREAVDDDGVGGAQRVAQARHEVERRLDAWSSAGGRSAWCRAMRAAMSASPGLGGGDEGDAAARRQAGEGEAALAAARATQNEE